MADNKKRQNPRPRRQRQPVKKRGFVNLFANRKKQNLSEFKPDAQSAAWIKSFRMTRQQRLRLAKWVLYILTVVLSLIIQDVIMSQMRLFGATTDLAVCTILLITVMEGTEVGSLFVFIASLLYYFSGSAPSAYCIALMTFLGTGASMFRQMYWHRSKGSVVMCSAIALTAYEMGLYMVGLYMALTRYDRLVSFLLTSLYSCILLIPLYSLIHRIGLIGGNTWKE